MADYMYLTRLFCSFVCLFVVFFLSFYKSPPPLILFNKLNLFNRHHLLLFNIFITVILITCPFTIALSIAALVVSALFICASSTDVLAFVEILGYCLFHNCNQVLKKLTLDALRKFFVLEDGFNSLNLATLEKLYLVHCFRMKEKCWKKSCRY